MNVLECSPRSTQVEKFEDVVGEWVKVDDADEAALISSFLATESGVVSESPNMNCPSWSPWMLFSRNVDSCTRHNWSKAIGALLESFPTVLVQYRLHVLFLRVHEFHAHRWERCSTKAVMMISFEEILHRGGSTWIRKREGEGRKDKDTKRTNTFAGTVQTIYLYERQDEFLGVRLGSWSTVGLKSRALLQSWTCSPPCTHHTCTHHTFGMPPQTAPSLRCPCQYCSKRDRQYCIHTIGAHRHPPGHPRPSSEDSNSDPHKQTTDGPRWIHPSRCHGTLPWKPRTREYVRTTSRQMGTLHVTLDFSFEPSHTPSRRCRDKNSYTATKSALKTRSSSSPLSMFLTGNSVLSFEHMARFPNTGYLFRVTATLNSSVTQRTARCNTTWTIHWRRPRRCKNKTIHSRRKTMNWTKQ